MLEFLNEVDDREFVFFLYQLALGRDPSEDDLLNSIASLRKGLSRDNFVENVFSSEEHINYAYEENTHFFVDNYLTSNLKMGDLLSIPDHIFIQSCYRIFLNRNIDSSGLKYYLGRLNKGYRRTRMIYDIVRSDEFALSAELKPIVDTITRF